MSPNTIAKFIDTPANDRHPKVASAIFRHRADMNIFEILWHHNSGEMLLFPLEQAPMEQALISVKAIQPDDVVRIPICQHNVSWCVWNRSSLWDSHHLTES